MNDIPGSAVRRNGSPQKTIKLRAKNITEKLKHEMNETKSLKRRPNKTII